MKPIKKEVATFVANDVRVANNFATFLTELDEHRFQAWETKTDNFVLVFYMETEADKDDEPKVRNLLENLFSDELRIMGIFDLKIN